MTSSHAPFPIRPEAAEAPTSGIVQVFTYGRGREGLIPLYVGEGDLPTPAFVIEAAQRSLAAGETFYTWQRGIPELRQALGTAVFAGMIGVTAFGLVFTPVFYVICRWLADVTKRPKPTIEQVQPAE